MKSLGGPARLAFEAQNVAPVRLYPNVELLRLRLQERRRRLISQILQPSSSSRKGTIEAQTSPPTPNQQWLERIHPRQRLCTTSLPAPCAASQIKTFRRSSRRPRFVRHEPLGHSQQQQAANAPSDVSKSSRPSNDPSNALPASSPSSSRSDEGDDDGTTLFAFGRHRMVVMAAALMQPLSIPEPAWMGFGTSPAPHAQPVPTPSSSSSSDDVWVCVHQERPEPSCPAHCYILSSLPHAGGVTEWPSSSQAGAGREGWPSLASVSSGRNGLSGGDSGSEVCDDAGSSMQELLCGLAHVMPPAVSLTGHTFTQCRNRAGPWHCYRLHVAEGSYGADEADVLFPNKVVLIEGEEESDCGAAAVSGASGRRSSSAAHVAIDASAFRLPLCSPPRSLHNAGSPALLCAWLSDPTPEKLTAHLTNLVTLPLRNQSLRDAATSARTTLMETAAVAAAISPLLESLDIVGPTTSAVTSASAVTTGPAAAAASRGSPGRTKLASGDWCYSRLQQTWGMAALSQLGYTKRHVAGLIMQLQDEWRAAPVAAAAAAAAGQGGSGWAKAG